MRKAAGTRTGWRRKDARGRPWSLGIIYLFIWFANNNFVIMFQSFAGACEERRDDELLKRVGRFVSVVTWTVMITHGLVASVIYKDLQVLGAFPRPLLLRSVDVMIHSKSTPSTPAQKSRTLRGFPSMNFTRFHRKVTPAFFSGSSSEASSSQTSLHALDTSPSTTCHTTSSSLPSPVESTNDATRTSMVRLPPSALGQRVLIAAGRQISSVVPSWIPSC